MFYIPFQEKEYNPDNQKDRDLLSIIFGEYGENLLKGAQSENLNGRDNLSLILQKSEEILRLSVKLSPLERNLWIFGNVLAEQVKYEEAYDVYDSLHHMNPNKSSYVSAMGVCALQMGEFKIALKHFKDVDASLGRPSQVTYFRALCLFNLSRYEEALEFFEKCKDVDPNDTESSNVYFYLGMCHQKRKHKNIAVNCYKKSIELDRNGSYSYFPLGVIRSKEGKFEEAEELFGRVRELLWDNSSFLIAYANVKINLECFDEAFELLDRAYHISPRNKNLHYYMGDLHYMQESYQDALYFYNAASALKCDKKDLHSKIGICCFYCGDYEDAELVFKYILGENPDDYNSNLYLARIYREGRNVDIAMKYIEKAFQLQNSEEAEDLYYQIQEEYDETYGLDCDFFDPKNRISHIDTNFPGSSSIDDAQKN